MRRLFYVLTDGSPFTGHPSMLQDLESPQEKHMCTYIELVKSMSAAQEAETAELKHAEASAWRERMTPLEVRVSKLLTTVPEEIKSQGLSIPTLRNMLAGKWRGKCHPGELGQALRKLGYQRRRNWSEATSSFSALWFPAKGQK